MYKDVCKLESYYENFNNVNKKNASYSDIIRYIERNKQAKVKDLSNNKNCVKVHIIFDGEMKKLKTFMAYLIKNNNFNNIENVAINKADNKVIYLLNVNFNSP